MWSVLLVVFILFSSMASADAGLFTKNNYDAALHIPWEGKTISWEFKLKSWGTWNIFAVSLNKDYISGTSGTDWEYVYYAKPINGSNLEWMGGNHGNEVLKTLTFIVDGKEIIGGTTKITRNLIIKETTDLVYPENKQVVGSVERKYVIDLSTPNRFDFYQQTTWHTDLLFDRAYMCMLPIMKKHGRHFKMGNVLGSFIDNKRTDGRQGWQKVTETLMYGDNGWGMIAGLTDPDSVDNFVYTSAGALIWDLSSDHVKLYYPRMYLSGLIPVDANSVWKAHSYYIVVPVEK